MNDARWSDVDDYITAHLLGDYEALTAALHNNEANGLPPIDVSPAQGKMLTLLAKATGARRILEIGTLGGYSTICLARALPNDGRLVTLELEPHHAAVARKNVDHALVGSKIDIRVGLATETLAAMADKPPFDFIFIDADKPNNVNYVREAIRLARPGATIIVDNVVREGGVLDAQSDDERILGTRALFEMLSAEPRLDATAIQTVGAKKWDGFVLAVVR